MTDIDTTVSAIAARKRGVTFAAAEDAPKAKASLTPVGTERPEAPLAGSHATTFPYDGVDTIHTALRDALKALADIQTHLDHVGKGVITLAQLYGLDGQAPGAPMALDEKVALEHTLMERERKRIAADKALVESTGPSASPREKAAAQGAAKRVAREAEGEEAFNDRLARLSAEAQAAVFKGDYVPAAKEVFGDMLADVPTAADETWLCPTHGRGNLVSNTSRKGRVYLMCTVTGCGQFEKEVQP